MKSKISLFNKGVCKNLLRRCWPVWVAYIGILVFVYPVMISDTLRWVLPGESANRDVLQAGTAMMYVSVVAGALVAMVMFSYLYSARSSGMMSSLPVRRETLFVTAYLTGLVPMLLADVIVVLLTWAFTASSGHVGLPAYLQSLAVVLMANVAFYSFAVFCAMLTGSIVIMPVVYLVLNLTAVVAEIATCALMNDFVYGMVHNRIVLEIFSPLAALMNNVSVKRLEEGVPYWYIEGTEYLVIYCIAGIVLAGAALLIYRRRHMEVAGDVVAVPILKPVFKYCMAYGTAVVFAVFINSNFFNFCVAGIPKALLILALLLIGAFIGYFIAEMLMQKTVRVFKGKWKGYAFTCLALAVFVFAFELDVFGYEKKLPNADDVHSVYMFRGEGELCERENIETAIEIHESIINNKKLHENSDSKYYISLVYEMNDGRLMSREYRLSGDEEQINDRESDLLRIQALLNTQEAINQRCHMEIPLSKETISGFSVYNYWYGDTDEYGNLEHFSDQIDLSPEEAEDFFYNYLLPDIQQGKMGRDWWVYNDEYYDTMSNVRFDIELSNRALLPAGSDNTNIKHEYFTFRLCLDAENCMRWMEENTDLKIMSEGTIREQEERAEELRSKN